MRIAIATAVVLFASTAHSACVGSGALSTCYDQQGNSYTVQRFGNSTYLQGNNAYTGSNWSQESHTFGNTTMHTGRDQDGNSWHLNESRIGNSRFISGQDSDGNFVSKSCVGNYCY